MAISSAQDKLKSPPGLSFVRSCLPRDRRREKQQRRGANEAKSSPAAASSQLSDIATTI